MFFSSCSVTSETGAAGRWHHMVGGTGARSDHSLQAQCRALGGQALSWTFLSRGNIILENFKSSDFDQTECGV